MNFLDVFWRKDWADVPVLGDLAWTSPGAFNLVEAIHSGATDTPEALRDFNRAAACMDAIVDGNSEFWFVICRGRAHFTKWLEDHDTPVSVDDLMVKFGRLHVPSV